MMISRQADLQPVASEWTRPIRGNPQAPILVVCDAQNIDAYRQKLPMDKENMIWMGGELKGTGLVPQDFVFIALSTPIPPDASASDARRWKHVEPNTGPINELIEKHNPRLVVTMGELASRTVLGRAVKITKSRGVPIVRDGKPPVMPMFSPWYVRRMPQNMNVFRADLATLSRLKNNSFDPQSIIGTEKDYRWVTDLSELIDANPRIVAYDTETTSLTWWEEGARVLLTQFTDKPGRSFLAPIHPVYFQRVFPGTDDAVRLKLVEQVRTVVENPFIRKVGHNIKYDHHMTLKEGMEVKGWLHDTQLMAFFADENILEKSLDECVRLFVPEMAGFNDMANKNIDKSRMIDLPPEDETDLEGKIVRYGMRNYAGGDTDATYRLAQRLDQSLRQDKRQYNCYRKVQWPALLAFTKVVERYGIQIDKQSLRDLTGQVREFVDDTEKTLIPLVPPALRREYLKNNEEMSLSRQKVMLDILFSKKGFGLKPVVFTPGTRNLRNVKDRVPSISTKEHMPYFKDAEGDAGTFVTNFIDWTQSQKLLTTYLGDEDQGSGFWQYIAPDGAIYPSYKLHATVTGRSASERPNGQNFPKRGRFAKAYNKIFVARPGYKLVSADLSQIELRLAAWMANELTMIRIYREGGDIHRSTAEIAAGVPEGFYSQHKKDDRILVENHVSNEFSGSGDWLHSLSPGERAKATVAKFIKAQRQKAKAVNFGYLYGMSAAGFKEYAKTNYGVDVTDQEAEVIRTRYFAKYYRLEPWHKAMKAFANQHGFVRSMHGAIRHLPSIFSTDRGVKAEAERQAVNSPIQRLGSDLGLMALWRFSYQSIPDTFRILGFIHDALVMEVKDGHEVEGIKALLFAMENLPLQEYFGLTPPLPIKAEAEIGLSFGDMHEIGDLPSEENAPDWMKEIGLESLSFAQAEQPSWWSDDWRSVETNFQVRSTLNV